MWIWSTRVGNFYKGFIFTFFASQEPFMEIKTSKILLSTWKADKPHFNPFYLELFCTCIPANTCVSECAFDSYC